MQAATRDKDRELEGLRETLGKQAAHADELEREVNQLTKECLAKEEIARDAMGERDESRRTVAQLQAQAADYISQINEYKHIIKRMSALHSNSRHSMQGSSCSRPQQPDSSNDFY